MRTTIRGLAVAASLGLAGVVGADDKATEPKDAPLEVKITGKKTTYTLDRGGLGAAAYAEMLAAANKGGKIPDPPAVDLAVEIKNTSDKPVTVWVKGDPVELTLELKAVKGKGGAAVNAAPPLAFTQEFRIPEGVEIAPGKTHSIPVKGLKSGHRGQSKFAYWTTPGEYELVATLRTGVSPAPKDAKDAGEGFGQVKVSSAPFKLTVEEKK